jgi:GT2 family glycosyltransferase
MLFSIVIPTFNRVSLLPDALASVHAQRQRDFEIIVVDDGSSDGTREYVMSLGETIRLVTQNRRGPGAARNAGAAIARGDYLAFLDSDDVWLPWTLDVMSRVIAERAPSMIAGRFSSVRSDAEVRSMVEEPVEYRFFSDYFESSTRPISTGAGTMVIARDAFMRVGGFTSQIVNGEDHDLVLRLGTAPGFVEVTQPVTIAWRRHAHSETGDLEKSINGAAFLIDQERSGAYPGHAARALERRRIITRHVRPITMLCLRRGRHATAGELYRSTFSWNAGAGRWAYLAAFPVMRAWSALRRAA